MAPSSNVAPSFNFDLGETVDMLRQTVQAFAQNEIAPRAMEADQRAEFPHDLWRKFGALGLLGITAEEEYGGTDMGYVAHVVAMEEISRASASVGLSYGAHSNLCINHRSGKAGNAQNLRYFPKLIRGNHLGAWRMGEPESALTLSR